LLSTVSVVRWPKGATMAMGLPLPSRLIVVILPSLSVMRLSRPSLS